MTAPTIRNPLFIHPITPITPISKSPHSPITFFPITPLSIHPHSPITPTTKSTPPPNQPPPRRFASPRLALHLGKELGVREDLKVARLVGVGIQNAPHGLGVCIGRKGKRILDKKRTARRESKGTSSSQIERQTCAALTGTVDFSTTMVDPSATSAIVRVTASASKGIGWLKVSNSQQPRLLIPCTNTTTPHTHQPQQKANHKKPTTQIRPQKSQPQKANHTKSSTKSQPHKVNHTNPNHKP